MNPYDARGCRVAVSSKAEIDSEAFRRALLESETLRLRGLLVILGAGLVLAAARLVLSGDPAERHAAMLSAAIFAAAAAFEAVSLFAVNRRLAAGAAQVPLTMAIGPLVEMLVPTLSLLAIAQAPGAGPARALTGPVVVVYYLLITLSILRLSPALSLATGVVAAAGYGIVYRLGVAQAFAAGPNAAMATGVFTTQVVLLAIAGLIAAAVAARVRSHVAAALREEAARREVERYQSELGLARQIQQGLLPSGPPAIAGFDVAGWNRPADETGGDYYDYVPIPGGRWVVVVADATGHGIAPALIMSACRAYLRASLAAASLTEALTATSAQLLEDLPRGKFVTLAAVRCSPGSGELEILSAGHGPMLVYRAAKNAVSELKPHGIPLGMLPGYPFAKSELIELLAGDMLVLLTDGFWEWEGTSGEQFGEERLKAALVAAAGHPAAEVIGLLTAAVESFAGGAHQGDDLTAVVLRRL